MSTPTWATTLARGPQAAPPPRLPGDAAAMPFHEASRLRAAAHHARRVYPGALGELVARELTTAADFGCRLAADGLAARLARQVLTLPAAPEAEHRAPGWCSGSVAPRSTARSAAGSRSSTARSRC